MPSILTTAIRLQGGGALAKMSEAAALNIEQALKRAAGLDPRLDLNLTAVRNLPADDLYRLLVLAAVGNFTSSAAESWQQDCRVVLKAETGLFATERQGEENTLALKVLVVVLCALQGKKYITEKWAKQ